MIIKIELTTDNAAFQDGNGGEEVARILRYLADHIAITGLSEDHGVPLTDINGNLVGEYITKKQS